MMRHTRIPAAVTLPAGLVSTTLVLTLAHASVHRDPPAPPATMHLSPFQTTQVALTQVGVARGQGTQYFRTTTLHGGDKLVIYGMWTVFNAAPAPAPQPVVTLQLFGGKHKSTPLRMRVWPRSHVALWLPKGERWPAAARYRGRWRAVITVRLGRTSDSVRFSFKVV